MVIGQGSQIRFKRLTLEFGCQTRNSLWCCCLALVGSSMMYLTLEINDLCLEVKSKKRVGTFKTKTAYCNDMSARLILIEVLVFIGSFAIAWLLRKLLGRLIRGWKVGLWGLLFGLIGAVLTILGLEALSFDFQFVDLGDGLNFVLVAIRLFGLTALAAGFLGAVVASFGQKKKKALPNDPNQVP